MLIYIHLTSETDLIILLLISIEGNGLKHQRENQEHMLKSYNYIPLIPLQHAAREKAMLFMQPLVSKSFQLSCTVGCRLRQYRSAACVRDVFFNNESSFNHAYKMLPEWLE